MTLDEAKRTLARFLALPDLPAYVREDFEGVLAVMLKQQRKINNQARELTKLKEKR